MKSRTSWWRRHLLTISLVSLGFILSISSWILLKIDERRETAEDFRTEAMEYSYEFKTAVKMRIMIVDAVRALFLASVKVERDEFAQFVEPLLSQIPGIQALEWIPRVPHAQRMEYEELARREGLADFRITELGTEGAVVPASQRDEYFPVYFVEPLEGNEAAVGFDLASNSSQLETLNQARDTGNIVVSERITLVQETGTQFGFLAFAPIYEPGLPTETADQRRQNLQGFTVGVFRVGDLVVEHALAVEHEGISIYIYDMSAPRETRLLYTSNIGTNGEGVDSNSSEVLLASHESSETMMLEIGGRRWAFVCIADPDFFSTRTTWLPWIVLLAGIMVTGMVGAYSHSIIRRSEEVENLVIARTQELRLSEARYRDLFENTRDMIQSISPDGSIIYVNRAWRETLGYTEEEISSLSFSDIIHPDSRNHCIAEFERVMGGEDVGAVEAVFVSKDGRAVSVVGNVNCSFENGKPVATRAIFHDVTERKEAEKALRNAHDNLENQVLERTKEAVRVRDDLARLIDTANAPIFGVDAEGKVNEWNQMVASITGYAKDEAMGGDLVAEFIMDGYKSSVKDVLDKALVGEETVNYEVPLFTKAGERVMLLLNATARRDSTGNIVGAVGVGQDITELDRSRTELAHERDNLELKVEERTLKLRESLERIEETNLRLDEVSRHKSKFLSSMSHELRTPLNAILGFADLLHGQFFGDLNEKQLVYVGHIDHSGKHLLELINDLLDMAKIDAGAMELELEEIPTDELTEAVVSMMSTQFRKKQLRVETIVDPALPVVSVDPRKCKQIIINLLSNAIKYTPEKGKIELRVSLHGESEMKVEVSDTGVGIEPDELDKIFSEFHQADHVRDEQLGGTGIGLALTRRLVELHGGELGVESEVGKGSTFWFILPLRKLRNDRSITGEGAAEPAKSTPTAHRILVAEDNEVNLSMILDMLSVQGHTVIVARNGQEAVELAQTFKPDLIFMDVKMPIMDGLEATRCIRAIPGFEDTPIIALTASTGSKAQELQVASGCTEHLPKPIQSKELFEVLRRYLGK